MATLNELMSTLSYCGSWTITNDVVNGRDQLQFRAGCSTKSPVVFTCSPDDIFDEDGNRFVNDLEKDDVQ